MMIKSYKLFTTPTCPNCPPVKERMKTVELEGKEIDAATDEGREEAIKHGVMAVPTVLFFDEKGNVVKKANSVDEVKQILMAEQPKQEAESSEDNGGE